MRPMARPRKSGILASIGSFFMERNILGCLGSLITMIGRGAVVSTVSVSVFVLLLTLANGIALGFSFGITLRVSVGVVLGVDFSASSAVVFASMPPETIDSTSWFELSLPTAFTAFLAIFSSSLGCIYSALFNGSGLVRSAWGGSCSTGLSLQLSPLCSEGVRSALGGSCSTGLSLQLSPSFSVGVRSA